jgi:murein tripeptide amidase MpaA
MGEENQQAEIIADSAVEIAEIEAETAIHISDNETLVSLAEIEAENANEKDTLEWLKTTMNLQEQRIAELEARLIPAALLEIETMEQEIPTETAEETTLETPEETLSETLMEPLENVEEESRELLAPKKRRRAI